MKNRRIYLCAIVLVLVTAVAAVFHLSSRTEVAADAVQLSAGGEVYEIALSALDYEPVSGIRVNGKGEEIPVEGEGISLEDLLETYDVSGYSQVSVVSDDSYSASVSVDEVQEGKAYLLLEEEQLRLIVFGDSNSKRSVSNVKQIIAE